MITYKINKGKGKTKITLKAFYLGNELIVLLYNKNAHIGAVSIGEYAYQVDRASASVITRLGHKEDVIAQEVSLLLSKFSKRPVCVIAGIHLDDITTKEIADILANSNQATKELISLLDT